MIGHTPTRLVPKDLIGTERRWLACVFGDGRSLRVETKRVGKDGANRIVLLNLVPLRDAAGTVVRAAAIEHELARDSAAVEAPPIPTAERPAPTQFQAVVRSPHRGRETILVVDDERPVRDYVCRVLRDHGYVALAALNGEEAVHIVETNDGPIHLVLSDVAMPAMDGRALFAHIRTWYPTVPFIFMSGAEPAITTPDVFDGSPTQFLAKPFGMTGLLEEVRQALDAKPEEH
jgi:CheY-like chemotaxis protein